MRNSRAIREQFTEVWRSSWRSELCRLIEWKVQGSEPGFIDHRPWKGHDKPLPPSSSGKPRAQVTQGPNLGCRSTLNHMGSHWGLHGSKIWLLLNQQHALTTASAAEAAADQLEACSSNLWKFQCLCSTAQTWVNTKLFEAHRRHDSWFIGFWNLEFIGVWAPAFIGS